MPLFNRNDKSWINTLIDDHKNKVIWITNQTNMISSSTMRRFSFAIGFKRFSKDQRVNVLEYELKTKGLASFLSKDDIAELCGDYDVNAAGIIHAINVLDIGNDTDKNTAITRIKTVLQSHQQVISGPNAGANKRRKDFQTYSLESINTSIPFDGVIKTISVYSKQQENKELKYGRPMSLLLYGMPGTGKSEFVYYLGHLLGKKVLLKRSSEIQSMWVGQTEKNISNAFENAHSDNSILFFDEADSFLFPRQNAKNSWEISHTNEILTQLETHQGIVIFATNDMPGLDHASLRRFRFKIEFKPLTPDGCIRLYNKIFSAILPDNEALDAYNKKKLSNIKNLTPGDFAVVLDQFAFVDSTQVTHEQLIGALKNEVEYKNKGKKPIGFCG
jgi:SpoVK/Ycf46/Vps4 family AAA+-type ATPase